MRTPRQEVCELIQTAKTPDEILYGVGALLNFVDEEGRERLKNLFPDLNRDMSEIDAREFNPLRIQSHRELEAIGAQGS